LRINGNTGNIPSWCLVSGRRSMCEWKDGWRDDGGWADG
jgi:hypothetical protein